MISREPFEAALNQPGFGKNIQEGININSNRPNFEFRGTVSRARRLIDSTGDLYTPEDFLRTQFDNVTNGTLVIDNNNGITIGKDVRFRTRSQLSPNAIIQEVVGATTEYRLRMRVSAGIQTPLDAVVIKRNDDANEWRIGLWTDNPAATLDLNGDLRVTGNLTVEGDTTVLEVENLKIQDKLIELATTSDSTIGNDIAVDGAGITVLSSDGTKDWTWRNNTNSWTSNVNINIANNRIYKIGGTDILSQTRLFDTVTQATGLVQVGNLITLNAANFTFASSTMTVSDALTINSTNDIIISNNKKITGVGNPTDPQDAATKNYVDNTVISEPVRLALDITGQNNADIGNIILALYPSGTKSVNTKAFISTSAYSGSVVTNPTAQTTKSFVAVDSGGVQNQSVVQDFSFTNATNTVVLTVTRGFKTFEWNGVDWVHQGDSIVP